jgi:hypothetical protein
MNYQLRAGTVVPYYELSTMFTQLNISLEISEADLTGELFCFEP